VKYLQYTGALRPSAAVNPSEVTFKVDHEKMLADKIIADSASYRR
jgi:hypothetical protein